MTDRELLEAAAKAAKMDVHWGSGWESDYMFRSIPRPSSPLVANVRWSPLTDDGDALRLMVKLELHVICNPVLTDVAFIREIDGEKIIESFIQMTSKTDPYESTRRAIVRAAAEIGRSMK
jgi:hypothetical protein